MQMKWCNKSNIPNILETHHDNHVVDVGACGPTCEVLLSELDQGEDHAVSHLVGQVRVERVQLDKTKQIVY